MTSFPTTLVHDEEQPYWDSNSVDSNKLLNPEEADSLSRKQWREAINAAATIDGPEGDEIRKMVEEFYSCDLNGEDHGHYTGYGETLADKESDSHKGSVLPTMYRESCSLGTLAIPTTGSDCANMLNHTIYYVGKTAAWAQGFNSEAFARKEKHAKKVRAHHGIETITHDSWGRVKGVNARNMGTKASRIAEKLAKLDAKAKRRAAKK